MWGAKHRYVAIAIGLAFTPAVAMAATATATATVVTLRPLTLVKTDDLDFGSLIASTAPGTVKIDSTTDVRTTVGGVSVAGGTPSAAHFAAAGVIGLISSVTLPTSIMLTRTGGTETMTVGTITSNGPTLRLFPGNGVLNLSVGGTLNVGANQAAGAYAGQFDVTVFYF
jgi:hypothetical protein